MKKIILFIFSSVLFIGLFTACASPNESSNIKVDAPNNIAVKEKDVREVVWNQLTSKDKERIKGTLKDGKLQKITLIASMGILNDNYISVRKCI